MRACSPPNGLWATCWSPRANPTKQFLTFFPPLNSCRLTLTRTRSCVWRCWANAGRFGEAISCAEKARSLALAAGQTEIVQKNQELLELYRAGRPYHETE